LEQAPKYGGVRPVNEIPTLPPLDYWISNGITYLNDKKNLQKFASTQKDHILSY